MPGGSYGGGAEQPGTPGVRGKSKLGEGWGLMVVFPNLGSCPESMGMLKA